MTAVVAVSVEETCAASGVLNKVGEEYAPAIVLPSLQIRTPQTRT